MVKEFSISHRAMRIHAFAVLSVFLEYTLRSEINIVRFLDPLLPPLYIFKQCRHRNVQYSSRYPTPGTNSAVSIRDSRYMGYALHLNDSAFQFVDGRHTACNKVLLKILTTDDKFERKAASYFVFEEA